MESLRGTCEHTYNVASAPHHRHPCLRMLGTIHIPSAGATQHTENKMNIENGEKKKKKKKPSSVGRMNGA